MSFSDYATLLPDGRLQDRYQAYWPRFGRFLQGRSGMIPLGDASFGLMVGENPVCTSSVIARGLSVRQAGGFDASLRQAEDSECLIRLSAAGPVAASTVIEVYHAARPDSLSHNVGSGSRACARWCDAIAIRRGGGPPGRRWRRGACWRRPRRNWRSAKAARRPRVTAWLRLCLHPL